MNDLIKKIVHEVVCSKEKAKGKDGTNGTNGKPINPEDVIQEVYQRGIMTEVMNNLKQATITTADVRGIKPVPVPVLVEDLLGLDLLDTHTVPEKESSTNNNNKVDSYSTIIEELVEHLSLSLKESQLN